MNNDPFGVGLFGMGDRIDLPERGFTCLAPWTQAMRYAGKRLENRAPSMAARIGAWRGMVAISQSKNWKLDEAMDALDWMRERGLLRAVDPDNQRALAMPPFWSKDNGQIVAVAELLDVLTPNAAAGDPWHVPGQCGLRLGRVWAVDPLDVSGAVGLWFAGECVRCGKVIGREAEKTPCRNCARKFSTQQPPEWTRPKLRIRHFCQPWSAA